MSLISVGQIIDRSWQHYTKHFVELMSITSWLLVIALLQIVSSWFYPELVLDPAASVHLNGIEVVGVILYALTLFVITPAISIWVFNAVIIAVDRQAQNKKMNFREISKEARRLFFPRLLVIVLVALSIGSSFLLLTPGILTNFLATSTESSALSLLAVLLLFFGTIAMGVAVICLSIRLVFSAYTLLVDGLHGRAALRQSLALTKGRFWSVFWRVILPKIIFFFGFFAAQVILLFILRTFVLNVAGLNVILATRLYTIGSSVIFVVLTALVNPLIMIADYHLYRSVKENR